MDKIKQNKGREKSLPLDSRKNILELKNITKRFGPVLANDNVSLEVLEGSIHGIVGENGAGKSTLMSILFGFYQSDTGSILVSNKKEKIHSSQKAISLGIGMVHQHFMLVPTFTVLENIILGNEQGSLLSSNLSNARDSLVELSNNYGLEVNPDELIQNLPVGMQQRVEILKSLSRGAKILVLDEPTGVLTPQETDALFDILRSLKNQGVTVILITHKLREIMAVTDYVSVMRNGKMVSNLITSKTSTSEIAELMVGRKVLFTIDKKPPNVGETLLSVKNLNLTKDDGHQVLKNISFDLKAGEILGIAGVAGNGQSELLDTLSGIIPIQEGNITILNQDINSDEHINPKDVRKSGIAHVPEDRQSRGIVLPFENRENSILGYHYSNEWKKGIFLDGSKISSYLERISKKFDVRPNNPFLKSANLSGGNQQKLVLAREIDSKPKILLVGQPTRGVDIGAIEYIHKHLVEMRENGVAVLLISVELDEIMSLSDRIIVMNNGEIVGELSSKESDEKKIGLMMAGIKN